MNLQVINSIVDGGLSLSSAEMFFGAGKVYNINNCGITRIWFSKCALDALLARIRFEESIKF